MAGIRTATTNLQKTPTEVVTANVEFSGLLADDETLSSVDSVSISPTGELVLDSSSVSGTKLQLTLSDGELDTEYGITSTVTTSEGQTFQGVVNMLICSP